MRAPLRVLICETFALIVLCLPASSDAKPNPPAGIDGKPGVIVFVGSGPIDAGPPRSPAVSPREAQRRGGEDVRMYPHPRHSLGPAIRAGTAEATTAPASLPAMTVQQLAVTPAGS